MTKIKNKYHRLDEEIIKDGLCAVAKLEDSPLSQGMYFLVGGIATQSYLPSTCRRPTADVDLAILIPLSYAGFREFASPTIQFLQDNGYSVQTKKGRNAFELIYEDKRGDAVIEFSRRTAHNFEQAIDRLTSESERSKKKIIEGRDDTVRVACPEDIVTPKLVRSVNSLGREIDYLNEVINGGDFPLTTEGVKKRLGYISSLRNDALRHIGDPRASERLRLVSDLFDIRVLSAVVGYNEEDLRASMFPWDSLRNNPHELGLISRHVLPDMNLVQLVKSQ